MGEKATRGPWWYGGQSGTWYRVKAPPPPDRDWSADHVCNAFSEADARLIAAAPELLAACEAMEKWDAMEKGAPPYDSDGGAHFRARIVACDDAFALARAAIRKARGETVTPGTHGIKKGDTT